MCGCGAGLVVSCTSRQMRPWADDFVELVLLHDIAQIRAGAAPVTFLNDAAIHIHDVERAIRGVSDIERTKKRIGRAEELGLSLLVRVDQRSETIFDLDLRAPDQPTPPARSRASPRAVPRAR